MQVTRLTRGDRQAETRQRLVSTAHDVFLRRGYQVATLDEIAGEAGVTKGAVYSNFASKADLFLAVYDARLAERLRAYRTARSAARSLESLARERVRAMSADDPDGRWASVQVEAAAVAAAGDAQLRAGLLERAKRANTIVADAIGEVAARAEVEFAYSLVTIASISSAILRGLLVQRLLDPAQMPTEMIEEAFIAFVHGMTRPRSGRAGRRG
jgi:AcrR family transcriptional regulator